MTIEEVRRICRETCWEFGYTLDVPVEENGRLKRSLGRVKFKTIRGKSYPERIEFSKDFLESGNENEIRDTVYHELAHYFVLKDTKADHGHDLLWKEWAVMLGAKPSATTKRAVTGLPPAEHRYFVVCTKCGKVVGRYARAGKVIKTPGNYRSKCCKAPIKIMVRK